MKMDKQVTKRGEENGKSTNREVSGRESQWEKSSSAIRGFDLTDKPGSCKSSGSNI